MKYPNVKVRLSGRDGNAFMILGLVQRGLRAANVDPAEIDAFRTEAMSGDYAKLLQTAMKWVDVT